MLLWGYLFIPGLNVNPSMGLQQDLDSGKSSQAWANAEELKIQHPNCKKKNNAEDHYRVSLNP